MSQKHAAAPLQVSAPHQQTPEQQFEFSEEQKKAVRVNNSSVRMIGVEHVTHGLRLILKSLFLRKRKRNYFLINCTSPVWPQGALLTGK